MRPLEGVECFEVGKMRLLEAAFGSASVLGLDFVANNGGEEIKVGQLFFCGRGDDGIELVAEDGEFEIIKVVEQFLVLVIHGRFS